MPAPLAAAAAPAAAGGKAATNSVAVPAAIAAGGGLATGLASSLMQDKPKTPEQKMAIPGGAPGAVSARTNIGNVFSGRPDIGGPQPRNSLAMQLLQARG